MIRDASIDQIRMIKERPPEKNDRKDKQRSEEKG